MKNLNLDLMNLTRRCGEGAHATQDVGEAKAGILVA